MSESSDEIPPCAQLGDYRILREVGRGGMGVVYEAEQVSLGRHVALKVLPFAAAIDPKQRQRFQIEAQAAAQLQHPHIVPIFNVGCDHGVHYYAMQFVEGRSLAAILHELRHGNECSRGDSGPTGVKTVEQTNAGPVSAAGVCAAVSSRGSQEGSTPEPHGYTFSSPDTISAFSPSPSAGNPSLVPTAVGPMHQDRAFCRNVARLGVEAADALDHAHGLGILHRDIKPANLLIDPHGALWITDFGLARFPSDLSVTRTGDMVGTLRYMSPEQALARRGVVDQRTDIYSLGVTLYELLTLRAAFDGRDHQELLRQIALEEPAPPRRLNAAVPRDLETIVLKAMAKDPASRYATAQEMAGDLRRFLGDRPIQARRPGPLERTLRWSIRHRDLVASTAGIIALALIISTAAIWAQAQKTEAASGVLREYIGETFPQADMLTMGAMAQASRLLTPTADSETREQAIQVYEQARKFYKTSSKLPPTDVESRAIIAWAHNRLGFAEAMLSRAKGTKTGPDPSQLSQAEADYRHSVALLEKLWVESPGNPNVRRYFARALGTWGWGWFQTMTQRSDHALPHYHRAVQLWRDLVRSPGARSDGIVSPRSPDNGAGEQLRDLYSFADDIHTLAALLEKRGRSQDAEELRRQFDDDVTAMAARLTSPELETRRRFWINQFRREATSSLKQENRFVAALNFRLVTILDPDNAVAHNNLAWTVASIPGHAPFNAARALSSAQKAVELDPANWMYWNTLGVAAFRLKDWKAADEYLQKSMELNGGSGAIDLLFLAMTRWHQGKGEEAQQLFNRAADILKSNLADSEVRQFHNEAAALLNEPCPHAEPESPRSEKGEDVVATSRRIISRVGPQPPLLRYPTAIYQSANNPTG